MDIINTVALAPLAQVTAGAAPAAAAAPNALAAARFAELMALPPDATVAANAVQGSGATTTLQPANATGALDANASVGDRILNGLQNVSGEFKSSWESVNKALTASDGDALTMQDMLQVQLKLVQASFQYDMVGKAISRSTQNLDQLVRIQ